MEPSFRVGTVPAAEVRALLTEATIPESAEREYRAEGEQVLPVSQNKTHCSLAWRLVGWLVDFCSRKVSRQLLNPKIKHTRKNFRWGKSRKRKRETKSC